MKLSGMKLTRSDCTCSCWRWYHAAIVSYRFCMPWYYGARCHPTLRRCPDFYYHTNCISKHIVVSWRSSSYLQLFYTYLRSQVFVKFDCDKLVQFLSTFELSPQDIDESNLLASHCDRVFGPKHCVSKHYQRGLVGFFKTGWCPMLPAWTLHISGCSLRR